MEVAGSAARNSAFPGKFGVVGGFGGNLNEHSGDGWGPIQGIGLPWEGENWGESG